MKLSRLCPAPLPPGLDLPLEVVVGRGARRSLPDLLGEHVGADALLVADPQTRAAAALGDVGGAWLRLPEHPHADDATVEIVRASVEDAPGLLAVGSGTINDLCKRAGALLGKPFVVFGTAASMNGYASGIAAILSEGLKTTVPASPARAIVLDSEVLAAAPPALAQAGLGDLLSKPVSDSDWWLSDQLEGGGYDTLPGRIVDAALGEAAAAAAGLAAREPVAHAALGRALVLSGVAMVAAGSSAPASGGEHLLSHLWDMEALIEGRPTRLHGAQVGVATCISAALYHRLLRTAPRFVAPPAWDVEAERIRRDFGPLADAVLPQAQRKHARAAARVETLRARWASIRDALAERPLPTPAQVRATLDAADAPSTLAALGITRADAASVLRRARDIRDRVTVLDVAFEVGLLPGGVDLVLDDAGV